jgi:hypothetical protein
MKDPKLAPAAAAALLASGDRVGEAAVREALRKGEGGFVAAAALARSKVSISSWSRRT